MNIRQKLLLSNICMMVLPLGLMLLLCSLYIHFSDGSHFKKIIRTDSNNDRLVSAQTLLYQYEAALSGMNWYLLPLQSGSEGGVDCIFSPEKERVDELKSLGFHIQAQTEDSVFFSNMDEEEAKLLEKKGIQNEGALFWSGERLIIQDSFNFDDRLCYLSAVYDGSRADKGVLQSLVPLYMFSPGVLFVFIAIAIISIILTAFIVSRSMNKAVLELLATNEQEHIAYNEKQRELIQEVTHDIRSPLTSIKGYALGLKDGIASSKEMQERYCDAILTRTEDLEKLTEHLGQLKELENGKSMLKKKSVDMVAYIQEFLEEKKSWLVEKQIEVQLVPVDGTSLPKLLVDTAQMNRVFMNLFENTVKYRNKDFSLVTIELRLASCYLQIFVSDDGPGVEKKDLKRIFELFYRADVSRTKPEKGSGLGLAIVKQIIEAHEGSVGAENAKSGGLIVRLSLPISKKGETS